MKTILLLLVLTFTPLVLFAEDSISQIIKSFDEDLMNDNSIESQVTIGFITFSDTNTCGSIVPFIQEEIKNAAEASRRIRIVRTTELSEYEQAGIATRGLTIGMSKKAKNIQNRNYILDGTYYDRNQNIELILTMHDAEGKFFGKKSAFISKSEIAKRNLTLFPQNQKIAEEIQNDFGKIENEQNRIREKDSKKKNYATKISLSASMLDSDGNLVNILYPNDIVRFKISSDEDCYISILCIDANGIKTWLRLNNNFIEGDTPRFFPDVAGSVLRVTDDGVFGAEQVVIYASTSKEGLPSEQNNGKYISQDLHTIMKKQQNAKKNKNYATGTFKITYTIMEKK